MSVSSEIKVTTPVSEPRHLFDAARRVVGDPQRWQQMDFDGGEVMMLQTLPDQLAEALVSVHYRLDGQPTTTEAGHAPGYVIVLLRTGSTPDAEQRLTAAVREIGEWLTSQGHRWRWRFEDGDWVDG